MVLTPWGDSSELRHRAPAAGSGSRRRQAESNQRDRLFGATVAVVAEKGYDATTVADLVALSGVSRSAFYRHFEDKQQCFLAAIETLVEPALSAVRLEEDAWGDEERARQAFVNLIELIVSQPAAAKMCFVEVYAVGQRGVDVVDRTMDSFEKVGRRMLEASSEHEGMPPELVRALIGGVQKVIHKRLYRGQEAELLELAPQLWEWLFCYAPPPGPLRPPRRRGVKAQPFEERQAASTPPERLLRALAAVVAHKGYGETSVADVVDRAQTSQRTFYEHFANKEEAMVAALDFGASQMMGAALPAYRRGRDWEHAVKATQEAMFLFGIQEPEYALLGGVAMYGAGKRALEQREMATEGFEALLAHGYEIASQAPAVTAEAIGGALYALLYDHLRQKGPARLAELVPWAVYVTLTPFLGSERAYAIATE